MSDELLAIIIAVCIFIPTVLFYHFVIVDNYLDKSLPATFKSLFSNGPAYIGPGYTGHV